ncbi:MAG: Fe-S protein assembly co-chaperone HscB [Candidatus Solibacter usitatus]|nr:Fe-S protein assembly co-chaperone HscB [Candidatus Solibacter usitatus]
MRVSPPPSNYFDFFGLQHKLQLDLKDLEKRFYALSREWHPDRFARAGAREQQDSVDASAILNDGYRTLRDPVARAEYLLKEQGFDIGAQKSNHVPPELLEEVFELNMALDELRHGDQEVRPQLEESRTKFLEMRREVDEDLAAQFVQYDSTGDRAILERIRAILNRRKYIRNLVNEVEKVLGARAE